jgi:hypothetical protein
LFVVAVEREFDRVAGVLANLEDYDAGVEPLASGHVVPLENQWANEKGMVGVQLLPIKVSNALRGFPEFVLVGERRFHALLVVLLNAREMEIRRQSGLGALLDFFEEENRDLVAVS